MKVTKLGQYSIVEEIKETDNSVVYCAFDKTGNKNAIKFIKKKSRSEESIKNEIRINEMIDCDYILPLTEVIKVDMEDFNYAFVMPPANENLFSYFIKEKKITEDNILAIIYNLLMALNYIHRMGITHRNIKLENILFINDILDSPKAVLSDFSLATSNFSESFDIVGSLPYMAPEMSEMERCMIIKH